MRKTLQWLITGGILAVTFLLPVILYLLSDINRVDNTTGESIAHSSILIQEDDFKKLEFVSIPPTVAISGGTFMYQVKVENYQDDGIASIKVISKPDWVVWNESRGLLEGVVPTDITSFGIKLSSQIDEGKPIEQSFSVQIEEDSVVHTNNKEVKGIKDSNWVDPFHPKQTLVTDSSTDMESFVLGASTTNEEIQEEGNNWIAAAIVTSVALIIYAIWSFFANKKNQFIRGTGRLIEERGKRK